MTQINNLEAIADLQLLEQCDPAVKAIFATFKEKKIKFLKLMADELEKFDIYSLEIEKLLAYHLANRNIRKYGNNLLVKVKQELEILTREEGTIS